MECEDRSAPYFGQKDGAESSAALSEIPVAIVLTGASARNGEESKLNGMESGDVSCELSGSNSTGDRFLCPGVGLPGENLLE